MRTSSHVGKSKSEREYYSRALKNLDYEPTVDDTLKFPETDDTKRDFSLPKSKSRRKQSFKQQVFAHLDENWIKWVFVGIGGVLLWLMLDSKIAVSSLSTKVDGIKEEVTDLKESDRQIQEKLHQQDLGLQEAHLKVASLEKKAESNSSRLTR